MLKRLDELTGPPVVGQSYLVPCVSGKGICSGLDPGMDYWPVVGQPHADAELSFRTFHFHYDWRFMPLRIAHYLTDLPSLMDEKTVLQRAQGRTLVARYLSGKKKGQVRPLFWIEKECLRLVEFPSHLERINLSADSMRPYPNPFLMKCETLCRGRRLDLETMRCPHKGFDLRQSPVVDGCVTCQGHGLRFNVTTGEMVSRFTIEEWCAYGPEKPGKAEVEV